MKADILSYAFYPGCSLESTAWDFDKSTRALCKALDIELHDIPDWVCCGSTPAHATNASLAVALPVINLQKAQAAGFSEVLTACASCYARLRTANYKVSNDPAERERAQRITEKPYDGAVKVRHILDVLVNDFGLREVRKRVRAPLTGLRVASYYGCLLSRPPEVVAFDDAEHPTCMDDLVKAAGAQVVDWPFKTECCGASLSISNTGVVNRLGIGSCPWRTGRAPSAWSSPVRFVTSIWISVNRMPRKTKPTFPTSQCSTSPSSWGWPWDSHRTPSASTPSRSAQRLCSRNAPPWLGRSAEGNGNG